jgi:hypothetical protein
MWRAYSATLGVTSFACVTSRATPAADVEHSPACTRRSDRRAPPAATALRCLPPSCRSSRRVGNLALTCGEPVDTAEVGMDAIDHFMCAAGRISSPVQIGQGQQLGFGPGPALIGGDEHHGVSAEVPMSNHNSTDYSCPTWHGYALAEARSALLMRDGKRLSK